MKHHAHRSKLGRKSGQRRALLVQLAGSLIKHGKIKTTLAKAKSVKPFVEKLITKAKNPTLGNTRLILGQLENSKIITNKLIKEVGPKYDKRPGGYTRIIKLPARQGDASPMAFIELV